MADNTYPGKIVSTQWVAEHLHDPDVRIVEAIWGSQAAYGWEAYAAGHIPGAVAWDYETDYGEAQGEVISKEIFEQQLSKSGITPEMTVVLYSSVNNLLATFEFWLMKYYGHEDVRLLDGDREMWLAEKRPLESTIPTYPPARYQAKEPDESLRARRADVQQAIRKDGVLLVDARSAEMYRGEFYPTTQRGGHIPGAINLAARREKEIITYCLRGGLSTHAWFVLTQLLGYPDVREYDRSWAEWGNLPDTPIGKGEGLYAGE